MIRGVEFKVHEALHRSLAHASYHVGQIVFLAKAFRGDAWKTLSIARGGSRGVQREPDSRTAASPSVSRSPCIREIGATSRIRTPWLPTSRNTRAHRGQTRDRGGCPVVAAILAEVDAWVAQLGTPMWELGEVDRGPHRRGSGQRPLLRSRGAAAKPAGTVKFQLEDPEFWPDRPGDNAAYIHRLAVRRKFAGGRVSTALMTWAVDQARSLGRDVLRLDCDADRTSLRAVYERFGFSYHSDRQVGPYFVARYEYRLAKPGSGIGIGDPDRGSSHRIPDS